MIIQLNDHKNKLYYHRNLHNEEISTAYQVNIFRYKNDQYGLKNLYNLDIGDRILTGPQSFGRIITLPDAEIAMIQLDHVLAVNGSMINSGSSGDHTQYVNLNAFEWDLIHEYWKPKFTYGDRITLQMTTVKPEPPRPVPPPRQPVTPPAPLPRTILAKVSC